MPIKLDPRRRPPIDLNLLATTDAKAAEVGFALNEPTRGGVSLDHNNQLLSWEELKQGSVKLAPQLTDPGVSAALARLQSRFFDGPNLTPATTPVLQAKDIAPVKLPSLGIDVAAPMVVVNGQVLTAVETYDLAFSKGQLAIGAGASALAAVLPGFAPLVGSPSWVVIAGKPTLYFLAADSISSPPKLFRAGLKNGVLQPPEAVVMPPHLDGLTSWPKVIAGKTGFTLVYRDSSSQLHLAASADGKAFKETLAQLPVAAMHEIAQSSTGVLALSYQQGGMSQMTSMVRVSTDGVHFTPPLALAPWSPNVHDTTLLPRKDGKGFDAYFIATGQSSGFSLYRRRVHLDGSLGAAQRLTDGDQTGEPSKPNVVRLPDGSVQVAWAQITTRAPDGAPTRQEIRRAALTGDCPS